jgi:hypothetical protein
MSVSASNDTVQVASRSLTSDSRVVNDGGYNKVNDRLLKKTKRDVSVWSHGHTLLTTATSTAIILTTRANNCAVIENKSSSVLTEVVYSTESSTLFQDPVSFEPPSLMLNLNTSTTEKQLGQDQDRSSGLDPLSSPPSPTSTISLPDYKTAEGPEQQEDEREESQQYSFDLLPSEPLNLCKSLSRSSSPFSFFIDKSQVFDDDKATILTIPEPRDKVRREQDKDANIFPETENVSSISTSVSISSLPSSWKNKRKFTIACPDVGSSKEKGLLISNHREVSNLVCVGGSTEEKTMAIVMNGDKTYNKFKAKLKPVSSLVSISNDSREEITSRFDILHDLDIEFKTNALTKPSDKKGSRKKAKPRVTHDSCARSKMSMEQKNRPRLNSNTVSSVGKDEVKFLGQTASVSTETTAGVTAAFADAWMFVSSTSSTSWKTKRKFGAIADCAYSSYGRL